MKRFVLLISVFLMLMGYAYGFNIKGGTAVIWGTASPAKCNVGVLFVDTDDGILYMCTSVDVWESGGQGSVDGETWTGTHDFTGATMSFDQFNFDPSTKIADLNEQYISEDDDTITTGATPSLTGLGSVILIDYAAPTTITGFTNITAHVIYKFYFADDQVTIDFTGTNLYGHGGIDWATEEGYNMLCYSPDGTKFYCDPSHPSSLAISMYYNMPLDSTPASNDSWHGPTAEFLAGELLHQWDLVYMTHDTGVPEIKGWDGDLATYKYYKPIGVVIESGGIADEATGTVGIIGGIGRNDAFPFDNNSDEGKAVYGTDDGTGVLSEEPLAVAGDIVCVVGIILDEDEVLFDFGLCASVEVP